jgi:FkbM family methyltransferase
MLKHKIRKALNLLLGKKLLKIYESFAVRVNDEFYGRKIAYSPNTDIGKALFFSGEFEKKEIELCNRFIKNDSVVLDIGANIGLHSISFSRLAPGGLVISFEPSKDTFSLLLNNIQGINNILPLNIGVSDKTQVAEFYVASDNAYSSLKDTGRKEIREKISVLCMSLDDLLPKLALKRIDFVKIDVEGFEQKVLEGMKLIIDKFNPVIFCEIYKGTDSNEDPEATVKYLINKGYKAFVYDGVNLTSFVKHDDTQYNYFFVPDHSL